MTAPAHTPTPWWEDEDGSLRGPKGERLDSTTLPQEKANKAFMLLAVNIHEDLVKRLRGVATAYHFDLLGKGVAEPHQHDLERCPNISCQNTREVLAKAEARP